jgi:hypothetical protein
MANSPDEKGLAVAGRPSGGRMLSRLAICGRFFDLAIAGPLGRGVSATATTAQANRRSVSSNRPEPVHVCLADDAAPDHRDDFLNLVAIGMTGG